MDSAIVYLQLFTKVAEGCDHLGKPKISHYIF